MGAGPAGLYAAEALVEQDDVPVAVDVIDRLPTPYGLVRYGVAPDHPRIKSVIASLQEVLEHPHVRYLGGLEMGREVERDDLLQHYDAVVYATGAKVCQRMGIPGEDLPGSLPASEVVSWYSGHPDAAPTLDLDARSVAVVGAGNVAIDIARMLVKTADDLRHTDLAPAVLDALRASTVQEVHLLSRRGPAQAKFTTKELRELGEIPGTDVVVDRVSVAGDHGEVSRAVGANLRILSQWADQERQARERLLQLNFWSRPVAILGDGRVEAIRVERTALSPDGALVATGEVLELPVQMVVRAVGYRSIPLPGVPFDAERAVVPNSEGRIVPLPTDAPSHEYVAGWLKRGPSGVIGTNKLCAVETVRTLLSDLATSDPPGERPLLEETLRARGHTVVTYAGWLAIDAAEVERGRADGRDRVKIPDWETLRALSSA